MAKVKQKVSGCFRNTTSAQAYYTDIKLSPDHGGTELQPDGSHRDHTQKQRHRHVQRRQLRYYDEIWGE